MIPFGVYHRIFIVEKLYRKIVISKKISIIEKTIETFLIEGFFNRRISMIEKTCRNFLDRKVFIVNRPP